MLVKKCPKSDQKQRRRIASCVLQNHSPVYKYPVWSLIFSEVYFVVISHVQYCPKSVQPTFCLDSCLLFHLYQLSPAMGVLEEWLVPLRAGLICSFKIQMSFVAVILLSAVSSFLSQHGHKIKKQKYIMLISFLFLNLTKLLVSVKKKLSSYSSLHMDN